MKQLGVNDFREALWLRFILAERQGKAAIDVNSGDLHREVGIYPASGHAMPTCCNLMRKTMTGRDAILSSPPKGRGATLTIRYALPRGPNAAATIGAVIGKI